METQRFNFVTLVAAFLRELLRGSRLKEQTTARNKLDARLAFLLSLPEDELQAIKDREERQLQEISQQITELGLELNAVSQEGDMDGEEVAALRARLEALDDRLFAPLTSGLFFPGDLPRVRFKEPHVSAFIVSDASSQDLAELGVNVRTQAGDIFTADVPLSKIPGLEALAAVRYIELSSAYFPSLDFAVPFAQIDTQHSATPAVTGAGVIVGIVDWHLDIYHPDFRTDQGPTNATDPTRVLYLWEQGLSPGANESSPPTDPTLPGFLVGGATYGVEYAQAAINKELANYNPTGTTPVPAYKTVRHPDGANGPVNTHGTHVAGIAVGNGRGLDSHVGAAPGADIIYVSYLRHHRLVPLVADSSLIMDAVAYVFARASALEQACVVNFSGGRNLGPHDGTSSEEQFLDNLLLTPGRAITLAAGNIDNRGAHAAGQVTAGGTTNLVLNYFSADVTNNGVADFPTTSDEIEIWYDGHDRFTVTVTAPTTPATVIGPVAPGASTPKPVALGGGVTVTVTSTVNDPRNHDNVITIIINVPEGSQIPVGNWDIALDGTNVINGAFQAWVERNNRGMRNWRAPHLQAGQLTIGGAATGRRTLAVGNHRKPTAGATPSVSVSSSRGPTRDGRIKPEVAATGTEVSAARSRNMNATPPGVLYLIKGGTSMAAPLVGGACALLFECRGAAATWADLKQILTDTAGNQGTAPGAALIPIPSNEFGFGYLQMANACAAPATDVDVWLRDQPTDKGIEPNTLPGAACLSPDIEVLDTAGNPAPNPTHHPTKRFNNIIRVTVRNRGTQTARNTEVYLYWGDPATSIPFPAEWHSAGIYTGAPNYLNLGNKIVIPELAAGASIPVTFAWAPPAPGSSLAGDDHFCLMVRLENEADASTVGTGGWVSILASNNLALRNILVQPMPTGGSGGGAAEMTFDVVGTADQDSLIADVRMVEGVLELTLPVQALPWRDMQLIERMAARRLPYGMDAPQGCYDLLRNWFPRVFRRLFPVQTVTNPLETMQVRLEGSDIQMRTDVEGATLLDLREGNATITGAEGRQLLIRHLHLAEGARIPVKLRVRRPTIDGERRYAHVMQLSGGQRAGDVTLELREDM